MLLIAGLQGEVLRRAALVAGAIGRYAVTGFDFANEVRCSESRTGEGGISRCGKRVRRHQRAVGEGRVRAPLRDDMEAARNTADFHVHCAMVLAVATAAGGKLRIVGSGGEGWRDQREAEEEQQQNGGRASHENIVQETGEKAELRCRH